MLGKGGISVLQTSIFSFSFQFTCTKKCNIAQHEKNTSFHRPIFKPALPSIGSFTVSKFHNILCRGDFFLLHDQTENSSLRGLPERL